PAQGVEGAEELGDALRLVQMAEAAEERAPLDGGRLDVGCRPRGMGYPPDGAAEAGCAGATLDVARVDDQAGGEPQDLTGQRELLRPRLPQRGNSVVDHRIAEQPARQPVPALERVEIGTRVAPRERQARDEMVGDEVVEHD